MKDRIKRAGKYRVRAAIYLVFAFLIVATVLLSFWALQTQKLRATESYTVSVKNRLQLVKAILNDPSGQFALKNSELFQGEIDAPDRVYVLPYNAVETEDPLKAKDTADKAGCWTRIDSTQSLCVAVSDYSYAGAYIYVVGSFHSNPLRIHESGVQIGKVHRMLLSVEAGGKRNAWVATFQATPGLNGIHKIIAYPATLSGHKVIKPDKEVRGTIRQESRCIKSQTGTIEHNAYVGEEDCNHESVFSMRLPIEAYRDVAVSGGKWPPPDLNLARLHIELIGPDKQNNPKSFLKNTTSDFTRSFSVDKLKEHLLPGESIEVRGRDGKIAFKASSEDRFVDEDALLAKLIISSVPIEEGSGGFAYKAKLDLRHDEYLIELVGDIENIEWQLIELANRLSWFLPIMILLIIAAFLLIYFFVIVRMSKLKRRAEEVSVALRFDEGFDAISFQDLKGDDEFGVLAAGLDDLLGKVISNLSKERIRILQEKDTWNAVCHEIMSPLQSLSALHGERYDKSRPYINRMLQAVKLIYGSASPTDGFTSATFEVEPLDICTLILPQFPGQLAKRLVWLQTQPDSDNPVLSAAVCDCNTRQCNRTPAPWLQRA